MVFNYQGVQKGPEKPHPQSLQVKDYMSRKLVLLRPEQRIEEAIQSLLEKRVSGAPVVDANHRVVGMISEGDCLKEAIRGKYNNGMHSKALVGECMTIDVITVAPDLNIFEAAQKFIKLRLRRFPVVHQNVLLGLISQKDVMRAVLRLRSTTW